MDACAHTAHVVRPYTKDKGNRLRQLQQYRSHFRAQLLERRRNGGEGDGDG